MVKKNNNLLHNIFFNFLFIFILSSTSFAITNPKIKVNPSTTSTIGANQAINIKVSTNSNSSVKYITYFWDNEAADTVFYDDSIITYSPDTDGTHTLYIKAVDTDGVASTSDYFDYTTFEYTVNTTVSVNNKKIEAAATDDDNDDDDDDEDDDYKAEYKAPTVKTSPVNNEEIVKKSTIKVYLKDSSDIEYVKYKWDDDSYTKVDWDDDDEYFKVTAPNTTGTHKLYVYARDEYGNSDTKTFKFYIVKTISTTIPDGTINTNVTGLNVELRSKDAFTKVAIDTEVTYYVDYYNATNYEIDECKIVLTFPQGIKVTNQNGGTIKK